MLQALAWLQSSAGAAAVSPSVHPRELSELRCTPGVCSKAWLAPDLPRVAAKQTDRRLGAALPRAAGPGAAALPQPGMHDDSRQAMAEEDALSGRAAGGAYAPPDRGMVRRCHGLSWSLPGAPASCQQQQPVQGWDGGVVVRTLSRLSSFATGQKETAELRALRITGTDLDQGLLLGSPLRRPPTPLEQFFEVLPAPEVACRACSTHAGPPSPEHSGVEEPEQQRRRQLSGGGSSRSGPCIKGSAGWCMPSAAPVQPRPTAACMQSLGDSWLIVRLALNLFGYLGVGTRWTTKALRLILYATLLMPGFIQVGSAAPGLRLCLL